MDQLSVQPYVKRGGETGLSVYVVTNVENEDMLRFQISDPSGDLVWNFEPERLVSGGVTYLGSSRVAMPLGSRLPQGRWKFLMMYKDGRSVERNFVVFYRDIDAFLDRSSATNRAFFSSETGLTYLPR